MARPAVLLGALTGIVALSTAALADGDFLIIQPANIPNFVGVGVGAAPDYVGSDNYAPGGLPFGRVSWGERYISLEGNFLSANVLDDPNWRLGPAGLYRFGRDDVDDDVVDRLPDIDDTIELGAFVAYELVDATEPRDRLRVSADVLHDVGSEHDGFVVSGAIRKWFPIREAAALGLAVAGTYGSSDYLDTYFSVTAEGANASGLPIFDADGGIRDVRATAAFVQSLSPSWHVGAGVLYGRLVGDVADSPIVDDVGSANQVVFGVGAIYAW